MDDPCFYCQNKLIHPNPVSEGVERLMMRRYANERWFANEALSYARANTPFIAEWMMVQYLNLVK